MDNKLNSPKTQVFISYCHEDVKTDRVRLKYFVKKLEVLSNENYEIHIDFNDTEIGSDINKFMLNIASKTDVAIVLMGPEYKKRVVNRQGGVFAEFNILYQRFISSGDGIISDQKLVLVPIVFCGSTKDSVIEELSSIIYTDLTKLYVFERDGEIKLAPQVEKEFSSTFLNISQKIHTIHLINQKEFKRTRAKYFNNLFINTKSDWDKEENYENLEALFIKTKVYYWVSQGDVSFIIGRKGSGKSTITHVLPVREKDRFNLNIPIEANDFYLETYYNLFINRESFNSDLRHVFRFIDAFRFVWDSFFHLAYIYTIVISEENRWSSEIYSPLKNFIFDLLEWDKEIPIDDLTSSKDFNAMFSYVFGKLPEFIDNCIKNSKPEIFGASLVTGFHIDKFRKVVFNPAVWKNTCATIQTRRRKITLTFDGFDTALEFFRTDSIKRKESDLEERVNFENNWLLSLILLVLDKGLKESKENNLYDILHYCIAIPYDRFIEIKSADRDAYRLNNRFTSIRWTGIELTALLRKRLLALDPFTENKSLSLEDRLTQVIKKVCPGLPTEITVDFNDRKYKMPLFLYVLRHTFWRPRDILTYYAILLSARDSLEQKKKEFDDSMIRELIANTTRTVVEAEFFTEFETVSNLKDIVNKFKRSKQIISWEEISEKIKDFDFKLPASSNVELSTNEKIEFLYEAGFIGVIVPEEDKNFHHKYAFIFNEDRFLQEKIGKLFYKDFSYIIHPIFSEYLQLDTKDNTELSLMFTWEYLHKNETMRHLRPLL